MRICLVSEQYPPAGTGGIAAYVHRLAHGLAAAGHDVSVITGPAQQGLAKDSQHSDSTHSVHGVNLYRVSNREFWLPAPVRRKGLGLWKTIERSFAVDRAIARLERTQGPFDIVEMPNWGAEALCYSLHSRAPLIVRLSTPLSQFVRLRRLPPRFGIHLLYYLEALPARRATRIIANSNFIANCCARLYRTPVAKSVLIPHGIQIPPAPPMKRASNGGEVSILYVGRLELRKGIDLLLQAIPKVIGVAPNCRFVIAGVDTGDAPSGENYQDYFDNIAPLAARQATTFLGYVGEHALSDLYSACDIFVSPSPFESFGLTFLEAMIHAKPVVAFRVAAVPEVVAHNETGILVELGNAHELVDALIKLTTDAELRHDMGKRGYERARKNFSVQRMVEVTIACYQKVVASETPGSWMSQ